MIIQKLYGKHVCAHLRFNCYTLANKVGCCNCHCCSICPAYALIIQECSKKKAIKRDLLLDKKKRKPKGNVKILITIENRSYKNFQTKSTYKKRTPIVSRKEMEKEKYKEVNKYNK